MWVRWLIQLIKLLFEGINPKTWPIIIFGQVIFGDSILITIAKSMIMGGHNFNTHFIALVLNVFIEF